MQSLDKGTLNLLTRFEVKKGIIMCIRQQGGECPDAFEIEPSSELEVKVWRRRVLNNNVTRELYAEIPRYTWVITNGSTPYGIVIMYEYDEYSDDIYSAAVPLGSIADAACMIGTCMGHNYYAPFRRAVNQAVPRVQVSELGGWYGVLVGLLGSGNPVVSVLEALKAGNEYRLRGLVKSGFITHVSYPRINPGGEY
jgi:hypothetical protein